MTSASKSSTTPLPDDSATLINQAYQRWACSRRLRSSSASSTPSDEAVPPGTPFGQRDALDSPDSPALLLRPYFPGHPKSLSGIALRAFCLGFAAAVSLCGLALLCLQTDSPAWRVPFFLLALSTFHFLEFWTTAEGNTLVAGVDSFLLTANWPAYAVAHSAAFLECLVVCRFFPARSWAPPGCASLLVTLGLLATVLGQLVRSLAMLHAGTSFHHQVQTRKAHTHLLVTNGVYAWMRHPSYVGFFYWGLGTQLVMGNVLCFFAYAWILWTFFRSRIRHEEANLVDFFKDDYVQYRERVGIMIPFIR